MPFPAPTTTAPTATRLSARDPERAAHRAEMMRQLEQLRSSVAEPDSRTLTPQRASRALTLLADALNARPSLVKADSEDLRTVAGKLRSSDPDGGRKTALVKEGLNQALDILVRKPTGPNDREQYQLAIQALARRLDAIDAGAALADAGGSVMGAFRAATDASFVLVGAAPPFRESAALAWTDLGPVEAELADAKVDVLRLGSSGSADARENATRALSSLADVLAAADRAGAAADCIREARFQAERLKRTESLTFAFGGWIRSGLDAVIDGLERVQGHSGAGPFSSFTTAARMAVSGIETHQFLTFQRSAIQDGFRATLDALQVALDTQTFRTASDTAAPRKE